MSLRKHRPESNKIIEERFHEEAFKSGLKPLTHDQIRKRELEEKFGKLPKGIRNGSNN